MKMNPKDINKNIDTIRRQKEVVAFLAACEVFDVKPMDILHSILQVEGKLCVSFITFIHDYNFRFSIADR